MTPTGQDLSRLETEQPNPRTTDLDSLDPLDLVKRLHKENHTVAASVDYAVPAIAEAVEEILIRVRRGGRLVYIGAGTSGRLGVLDASECPPTFGVEPELVQGIIAGGNRALTTSVEGAEDVEEEGARALEEYGLKPEDSVIGIASSGRTPYVKGALRYARDKGAYSVALVNVSNSEIEKEADLVIRAVTGPEPITGSTRLKAGTAQKMILNLITNSLMVRLGKVYGNLMIDLRATNTKLKDRARRIVMKAAAVDEAKAAELLAEAEGSSKVAIVMQLKRVGRDEARALLEKHDDQIRKVLDSSDDL
ncbi:MAG TPA: N-acetylmuramic acid 6-phosphate etherase [Candidatus Melainabacteria bacterium]|nr:N-acetylmuramic acid 6-phosphate etherase [Candidatus Melainabacteria bacterium]HMP51816.1 N-acetylmuramic acid 6-phosphate etherase [Candidatus Melainabacteria bacterium]